MYNDFYLDYFQLIYLHKLETCQVCEYFLGLKAVTAIFEDNSTLIIALNEDLEDSKNIIIINSNENKFKKIMYKTIFYHEGE